MEFLALFDPETIKNWIEAGWYVMLFGLLFACGLGLPLPEDIPLMVSGWLVATGDMRLGWAAVCAWCGIIGGDLMLYHFGKKFGLEITRVPYIGKHVTRSRIERAETLFSRYGVWVVAIGRLFAGIRGAMVIAAGAIRFNLVKFLIADGLAALVSGGIFMALGYWFGSRIGWLRSQIKEFEHILLIVGIVAAVGLGVYIWWRRRKHTSLAEVALKHAAEHAEQGHATVKPVPNDPSGR